MNDFDNMALCLFDEKLVGGLAFMTNFKNYAIISESTNCLFLECLHQKMCSFFMHFRDFGNCIKNCLLVNRFFIV